MTRPKAVDNNEVARRLFAYARSRAALAYAAVAVLLVIALVIGGNQIGHHINEIETAIRRSGPWGVLVFVWFFVLTTSILIPDTLFSIMAGALFGLGWGIVAVSAGGLLAAALQYALSRWLLRGRIERALAARPSLLAIQRAVKRNEVRLQLLLRLTPLNPATLSYVLGAAGVRFLGFQLASIASIPNLVAAVYFGYVGRHVARMADRPSGVEYLHEAIVVGGVVATITVLIFVAKLARKAVMEAVGETVAGVPLAGDG